MTDHPGREAIDNPDCKLIEVARRRFGLSLTSGAPPKPDFSYHRYYSDPPLYRPPER